MNSDSLVCTGQGGSHTHFMYRHQSRARLRVQEWFCLREAATKAGRTGRGAERGHRHAQGRLVRTLLCYTWDWGSPWAQGVAFRR